MKIVSIIFCTVLLCSFFPVAFGQQYYDDVNKYMITPPVGWEIFEQQDQNFGRIMFFVSNEEFKGQRPPFFMIIRIADENIFYQDFLDDKQLQENFVQEFVRIGLINEQVKHIKIDEWNFEDVDDGYLFEIHGEIVQEDSSITKYSAVGYILKSNEVLGLVYYASPEDFFYSFSEFFESVQSFQYEERIVKPQIPEWIRSNAEWWSEGKIKDQDFLLGIQYLINQNIIKIPETKNSQNETLTTVPNWVKDTAGWWAQGNVSDDEFVNGIKFLIEKGIISV